MSISITVLREETKANFPKLMMNTPQYDLIVYFTAPKVGHVVFDEAKSFDQFHHADDWRMSYFEDFHGEITLKNRES